jgi:hypothetical protein
MDRPSKRKPAKAIYTVLVKPTISIEIGLNISDINIILLLIAEDKILCKIGIDINPKTIPVLNTPMK